MTPLRFQQIYTWPTETAWVHVQILEIVSVACDFSPEINLYMVAIELSYWLASQKRLETHHSLEDE